MPKIGGADFFVTGVQMLLYTLKYLDRESKYFEVVGSHGGPVISERGLILLLYSEVIGPGGTILGGDLFFRDSAKMLSSIELDIMQVFAAITYIFSGFEAMQLDSLKLTPACTICYDMQLGRLSCKAVGATTTMAVPVRFATTVLR